MKHRRERKKRGGLKEGSFLWFPTPFKWAFWSCIPFRPNIPFENSVSLNSVEPFVVFSTLQHPPLQRKPWPIRFARNQFSLLLGGPSFPGCPHTWCLSLVLWSLPFQGTFCEFAFWVAIHWMSPRFCRTLTSGKVWKSSPWQERWSVSYTG